MRKELINRIIEQRREVNRVVRDRTAVSWVELSLTIPQLKSLFYISRHGKIKISGLASGIKVTPGNVTGIVDRLVEQKLLAREQDSNDRRILWLTLTARGKTLIDELREGSANELAKILEKLSEAELNDVFHGFELLAKAASSFHEEQNGEDE
ncbi:MAG: MarR family transcriptional regulator [Dehalococcoidales bacterium]|nr:MarR family transcriptional regulator [Dehalococcoidales bacterium]